MTYWYPCRFADRLQGGLAHQHSLMHRITQVLLVRRRIRAGMNLGWRRLVALTALTLSTLVTLVGLERVRRHVLLRAKIGSSPHALGRSRGTSFGDLRTFFLAAVLHLKVFVGDAKAARAHLQVLRAALNASTVVQLFTVPSSVLSEGVAGSGCKLLPKSPRVRPSWPAR